MAETTERAFSAAVFTVKKDKESQFLAIWKDFAYWTLSQYKNVGKGAILVQDIDNPQKFLVIGEWNSFDDIKNWRERQEFKDFFKRAKEFCENIEPMALKLHYDMTMHPEGVREEESTRNKAQTKSSV